MGYWGIIEQAAAGQMTTQEMWQAIHESAEEMGLPGPGVTVRGVSELRGIAGRIQRSGRDFQKLGDTMSLSEHFTSQTPWSRSLGEQNALGIYHVRYQHTTLGPDNTPTTEWRTSVITGQLPQTAGELRSIIEEDASQLATKYGVDHVDFGAVQILVV